MYNKIIKRYKVKMIYKEKTIKRIISVGECNTLNFVLNCLYLSAKIKNIESA